MFAAAPEILESSPPIEFRIPWDVSPDSPRSSESECVSMSATTESSCLDCFFASSSFLVSSFACNRRDLLSTGCTCFAFFLSTGCTCFAFLSPGFFCLQPKTSSSFLGKCFLWTVLMVYRRRRSAKPWSIKVDLHY